MAEQDKTSLNNTNSTQDDLNKQTKSTIYTRSSIGYAGGYGQYTQKSGAHSVDGTQEQSKITKSTIEREKSTSPELLLDLQSDRFRRINGYSRGIKDSANDYEDPTFLIFDLFIDKSISPLFNDAKSFIDEYATYVPELDERKNYWQEFVDTLFKIFPSDSVSSNQDGIKRHYIEAIGGLDVLLNPIINYPEDIITFSITEDIAMTLQYLAELYNNLVYSYDTHRYLIPDNLLRFNMTITIHDIRNMKNADKTVNNNISKFVYVLHDCQFNFMGTKNFGAEIRRAGFSAGSPSLSAGGVISMNFKSYSKITAPLLIANSKVVDFREREPKDSYSRTDGDYKTSTEVIATETYNETIKNITYRSKSDIIQGYNSDNLTLNGLQIPDVNTSIRGFQNIIKKEIVEVRDVIIKQIYEEVNQLVTEGQRIIGNKLGFTLGKVNVYYDSLEEKISNFSYLFESFLEGKADDVLGRGTDYTTKEGNVYGTEPQYNEKYPSGDVHPNGIYNQKFPEGDKLPDGKYNEKYPSGDVHLDGAYNEKYPNGDVHPDGKYNEKYPEGDKLSDGKYNEKYPEGDKLSDGKYNEKYPSGDVQEKGTYNEKYPSGDVQPDGKYNQKFPEGDILPKGSYNEKYPEGDKLPDSTYNEKYPSGDVQEDGNYNEKHPEGEIYPIEEQNRKTPNGNIYGKKLKEETEVKLGNIVKK